MQPFRGGDERHGPQAQVLRRLRRHPRRHARQVAGHPEKTGQQNMVTVMLFILFSPLLVMIFGYDVYPYAW